jgi:hypothetical protein
MLFLVLKGLCCQAFLNKYKMCIHRILQSRLCVTHLNYRYYNQERWCAIKFVFHHNEKFVSGCDRWLRVMAEAKSLMLNLQFALHYIPKLLYVCFRRNKMLLVVSDWSAVWMTE